MGEAKELDEEFFEMLKYAFISLGKKTSGDYRIEVELIPAGKELRVVSQRNWLMMGYKPLKIRYDVPRLLHKLKRKKDLLMSDSPQELFLQYDAYNNAKGKILVGGLGLGLYPSMVAKKKEVTEITVVEISKDVIKLCKPKNKKIKVVQGDIKEFIKNSNKKFDYAYIDIHYRTGCTEYINTVLPIKKLFEAKHPNTPIEFWGEEEMKAQYNPNFKKSEGM